MDITIPLSVCSNYIHMSNSPGVASPNIDGVVPIIVKLLFCRKLHSIRNNTSPRLKRSLISHAILISIKGANNSGVDRNISISRENGGKEVFVSSSVTPTIN